MEALLKTVAREYAGRYKNLKGICFLFPNKRCGTFLRKYFAEYDIHTGDLLHIHTISEFAAQIARKSEAGRIVQLLTLYKSYLEILNVPAGEEPAVDFESFRVWGETVISDFNTVDLNLADPNEIFKNIKDFREIATDFLTDEQKEVMKEYFGVEPGEDTDSFWKVFEDPSKTTPAKQKFLNLWQVLAPLHEKFIGKLEETGHGTTGSIFRAAALRVREKGKEAFPYKKIVAVGFNALTESERTIFKALQEETPSKDYDSFIDFVWDATGPILKSEEFTASRFVDYNRKHFPMPQWLEDALALQDKDLEVPEINILSAPSNTAQTKVAGDVLKRYLKKEDAPKIKESKVALVLPDEALLSNMLYSLPDDLGDINLTMGISLRHTSISGFMSLLRRLYVGMSERKGEKVFYSKDLKIFFSHPLSYALFDAKGVFGLMDHLISNRLVTLSKREIAEWLPEAGELLDFPPKNSRGHEIFNLVEKILTRLIEKLDENQEVNSQTEEKARVRIYKEYVESLEEALRKFEVEGLPLSILSIVNKLVAGEKIGFEGEPLVGLQVMGTLETRCLDFEDVIVLSMNEGLMPRKAMTSTFIPDSLRKAYGLPPARYAEEIFGYYFYRLISRAKRVTLIYDGRTISGMRGGISRYLLQLKQYLPARKVKEEAWQYPLQNRPGKKVSVEKNDEIRRLLDLYTSTEPGKKNFSASTLNHYRECGVKFLLNNVLNLNSDPERTEYMDAITIGNVLHEVMMWLYLPDKKEHNKLLEKPKRIEKEYLEKILNDEDLIQRRIRECVRALYYGDREGTKAKVESGVNDIIAEQIEELVKIILTYDMNLAPFNLYGCEISKILRVKLSSGRVVNFRFAIDRLDEIDIGGEKTLRIVDYKTGRLKLQAKDLEEVFEGGYGNEHIFQLFMYAWLLGKVGMEGWEDVMTEIYYIPALNKGKPSLPVFDKVEVRSFRNYHEEFNTRLEAMIESIFEEPCFSPAASENECTYCNFRNFCK